MISILLIPLILALAAHSTAVSERAPHPAILYSPNNTILYSAAPHYPGEYQEIPFIFTDGEPAGGPVRAMLQNSSGTYQIGPHLHLKEFTVNTTLNLTYAEFPDGYYTFLVQERYRDTKEWVTQAQTNLTIFETQIGPHFGPEIITPVNATLYPGTVNNSATFEFHYFDELPYEYILPALQNSSGTYPIGSPLARTIDNGNLDVNLTISFSNFSDGKYALIAQEARGPVWYTTASTNLTIVSSA